MVLARLLSPTGECTTKLVIILITLIVFCSCLILSALKTVLKRRPFILSRSTAPGYGFFGAHWDGDAISDFDTMKWTISCKKTVFYNFLVIKNFIFSNT